MNPSMGVGTRIVESSFFVEPSARSLSPVTAVIVALGVYPQLVLERTEEATVAKVAPAAAVADGAEPQAAEPEPAQEFPPGTTNPPGGGTVTPEELERLQGGGSP